MRKTIGKAALGGLLLLGLSATPALAQPTATTNMSIIDATKGACSNGNATWRIHPKITVNNDSDQTDTFTDVSYTGKYSTGGSQIATNNTSIIDDGGLKPGVSLAPRTSRTFLPTVDITIPCNATAATLFVVYDIVDGHKTFQGGAQFVTNGTPVPAGAIGAVGFAGAVGVALLVRRRFNGAAAVA